MFCIRFRFKSYVWEKVGQKSFVLGLSIYRDVDSIIQEYLGLYHWEKLRKAFDDGAGVG